MKQVDTADNRVPMLPPGGKGTPTKFLPQTVDAMLARGWTKVTERKSNKPAPPANSEDKKDG